MSDELVERARSGDAGAWQELYESTTGRLLVWLRTRPSGDAAVSPDDVAAEAWLIAARSIADFHGDRSAFAGWLFGIARNLTLNTQRRSSRRATFPVDPTAGPDVWGVTDCPADDVVAADWVRGQLAVLSPREADVLAMTEVAGLDIGQTAAALDIGTTAVRVARHRALARLRRSAEPQPNLRPA